MARSFKTPITVDGDISTTGTLKSTTSTGDEGGEIFLNKAVTNTTLTTGVTIDVYQNKLRFWEVGGNNRGYFLDISSGGNSVGTNIIGSATAVVNTVTGTNSAELVRGNMADNDQFRILVGGTAGNAGFAEIATADDGTEPIYVRQYTGVFSTIARTATILDGSGNTSFPGTVSGTRFISNVATGTAPFTVSSTTMVTNLNADLLEGYSPATANGASTIVLRDASGNFAANQATLVSQKFGLAAGAPSFTSYSAGVRSILYDNISGSSAGYTTGINSGEFWHTTSDTTGSFTWYGGVTLAATLTGTGAFTAVGTITAPTFSGSGASLTNIPGANVTGTLTSTVLGNSTAYVGTTAVALNRSSANQALTGISSVTLPGSTSGTIQLLPTAIAGTGTVLTLPATTGTLALTSQIPTVNNGTLTLAVSGTGLSGSQTFTANQSGAATFTVTSNANSANGASTIVARDATGNFAANVITAVTVNATTLSGSGSALTSLPAANITGSIANAVVSTSASGAGYVGMPQNSQSGAYTLVAGDAGKHIYYTVTGQTVTIPANSSVSYQIGTTITFITAPSVSLSIAITTDTLRLANTTTTGTRTLAANGIATAVKTTATTWIISGNGLT